MSKNNEIFEENMIIDRLKSEIDQLNNDQLKLYKQGLELTDKLKETDRLLEESMNDTIIFQRLKELEYELKMIDRENTLTETRLFQLTRRDLQLRETLTAAYRDAKEEEAERNKKLRKMLRFKNKISKTFEEMKLYQESLEEGVEKQKTVIENKRDELQNLENLFIARKNKLFKLLEKKQNRENKNKSIMNNVNEKKEEILYQNNKLITREELLKTIKFSLSSLRENLSKENKNIEDLRVECQSIKDTIERNKEEKILAENNVDALQTNIIIKSAESKNQEDEMKIFKEQINNQNKEVYVIEKKVSSLEHKKEVKDKWNEMKQSAMLKKSKEIASLKKICFELQNSIENLRKQNINLEKASVSFKYINFD
ncbi:putative leucine-rich repeat-containing protein DDB_G0290503 [Centruroides vittatus]|uniref:putative leucine-rich repeat-containing protein DDB_G0290503 n=1 Tax=Centruroides vittatus TaxID=120091 RepID=UPI00350F2225